MAATFEPIVRVFVALPAAGLAFFSLWYLFWISWTCRAFSKSTMFPFGLKGLGLFLVSTLLGVVLTAFPGLTAHLTTNASLFLGGLVVFLLGVLAGQNPGFLLSSNTKKAARDLAAFDRKSPAFEAHRRKHFPMPYPNGWFGIGSAKDLKPGQHKSFSALGKDFVVFRGENGKVGVLDAHCPHIGAHLGEGGRVVGNCIECPFHNWQFDSDGKCTHIPYTTKSIPAQANTK